MSIVKSSNTPCNTKSGLKAVINYIFAEKKTNSDLTFVTGDYMALEVTPQKILRNFMETKEMFDKTDKRQCKQFIVSWHKDSPITHEEALEICKDWAEKIFPDFTCAIAVHTDRDHVHGHVLVNSVNYVDGTKYHMDPWELDEAKDICDQMNIDRGFHITEKGKHFDGTEVEPGTLRSYDKKGYIAMTKKDSNLLYIATAVIDAKNTAISKDDFIMTLDLEYGIEVEWSDSRKYITFTDTDSGFKVRDKKLGTSISMKLDKETLTNEFNRNANLQEELSREKTDIDERCGILEGSVRELGRKYQTDGRNNRTEAEKNSTVGGRTGNGTFREWPVERLAGKVADNEQRTNRLLDWGKNAVRKLGSYLGLFRNSGLGRSMSSSELEWEARKVAEDLERYRCQYIHNEYELRTQLLPYFEKRPEAFRDLVDSEYRSELSNLDSIQYILANTDPVVLILAQSMRPRIRPEQEADSIKIILDHEHLRSNGLSPADAEREFLLCAKKVDEKLKDLDGTITDLCESRGYEKPDPTPVIRRGRHL